MILLILSDLLLLFEDTTCLLVKTYAKNWYLYLPLPKKLVLYLWYKKKTLPFTHDTETMPTHLTVCVR